MQRAEIKIKRQILQSAYHGSNIRNAGKQTPGKVTAASSINRLLYTQKIFKTANKYVAITTIITINSKAVFMLEKRMYIASKTS